MMDIRILREIRKPIFYVTNDVGHAIGLENILPNYHIICLDEHPMVDYLERKKVSVFCLERVLGKRNIFFRSAGTILGHPRVLQFIKEKSLNAQPNILFFKPQRRMEIIAQKQGFNLLGNLVEKNRYFEDKVNFLKLCQKMGIKTPPGELRKLSEVNFALLSKKYGKPFVLQFGRGWAGNSTFFVDSEETLQKLQSKFGKKEVKISKFIKGLTVLNNSIIFEEKIYIGQPALQIKAETSLTSMVGGTGGRQWPVNLEKEQVKGIEEITKKVGRLMIREGYRGFFGLDFLIEEKGEVFLSENNARLTASVPFYTKLELKAGNFPSLGFHLLSFLPTLKLDEGNFIPTKIYGSEIIMRNSQDEAVYVEGEVKTGIYDNHFRFKKEAYFLDSEEEGNFWLQAVAPQRIVNQEIELAKVNTYEKVCTSNGRLLERYLKILLEVKRRLKLKHA